jgi:hypothetical protein
MHRNWIPSIVPKGDDQNVYRVINDFGLDGRPIARPTSRPPKAGRNGKAETLENAAGYIMKLPNAGQELRSGRPPARPLSWRRSAADR